MKAARFLVAVVGFAHARQMDSAARAAWRVEAFQRSKTLDAPPWRWSTAVELLASHERVTLSTVELRSSDFPDPG